MLGPRACKPTAAHGADNHGIRVLLSGLLLTAVLAVVGGLGVVAAVLVLRRRRAPAPLDEPGNRWPDDTAVPQQT
jgi:hypothetical protein